MAHYSKRDARKEWVERMAAHPERLSGATLLTCHCGAEAVIAFTPESGHSRFFCAAHESEAEALFGEPER